MTFYLKPPRGIIEYHILQKCAEERLRFFKSSFDLLIRPWNTEYLFEDSAFDRAGHFMLRLAAIQDSNFLYSFIHYEVQLLELRLNNYNSMSTQKFLNKLLRHIKESLVEYRSNEEVVNFLTNLMNVILKMCTRSYRQHVLQDSHSSNDKCKLFTVNVPYIYCTTLVSERRARLKNGYVRVVCDQWKDLIISLFNTFLITSIKEMKHNRSTHAALNDHRIKSILSTVFVHTNSRSPRSTLQDFNMEIKLFPLCMRNLQNTLQQSHRLPHEERYNYSLFLKDIGMSLDDSLKFWKNEYSKESHPCGKCCHSWYKDEKRYIYSIRHLYGLEGSRKNYSSRSCHYFQNNSISATQEGGCPFKHFDNENLKKLLVKTLNVDIEDINRLLLERSKSASSACNLFMQLSFKNIENVNSTNHSVLDKDNSHFITPVQYFHVIKNLQ
ncbi:hypothetical protein RN001_009885 [Aquatica leii]|uniref:DNA primase large subunit C-terminal domain-containing protein n=1 Tax=Aquatica leii TaxID=1421715 RepID=A0AAN7SFU4_9COLE|nr:hypothetical protein RN001_009885 [Aquatica leii]